MRFLRTCGLALAALAVVPAAANAAVTLELDRATKSFGSTATFTGAVTPAASTRVEIFRWSGAAWRLVVAGDSHADGTYSLRAAVRRPGPLVARAAGSESDPVDLRVRPSLGVSIEGLAVVGASLRVQGRVRPADAGALTLTTRGRTRAVPVNAAGRYRFPLPTRRAGRLGVSLRLEPAAGYVGVTRGRTARIGTPVLRWGSRGPAVRFLERRLRELRYALRGVDQAFSSDTRDAVYAFEKVEGLPRDGVVGQGTWRRLLHARTPRARVRSGDHIEVIKTRQVLYEVRRGKVVRIVHVSTGATGNTPVGRWRVYRKSPGYNIKHMYYSLYFLRGFAIHGYASVPPFQASHGCVRIPIWYARTLYSHWQLGGVVRVFP